MTGGSVDVGTVLVDGSDPGAFEALLDAGERSEAERFRLAEDRRRFVAGRGLLRRMLGQALAVDPRSFTFRRDPFGKPLLDGGDGPAFNVSHSGNVVMVAVGPVSAIGIDVEAIRPAVDIIGVGREILAPPEFSRLASAPEAQRLPIFYRFWVLKEALVKGLGTGLSLDPRRFEVAIDRDPPSIRFVGPGRSDIDPRWTVRPLPAPPGYAAALAVLPSP